MFGIPLNPEPSTLFWFNIKEIWYCFTSENQRDHCFHYTPFKLSKLLNRAQHAPPSFYVFMHK